MVIAGEARQAEAKARLRAFGLDADGPLAALVVSLAKSTADKTPALIEAVDRFFSARGLAAVVPRRGTEAIALVSWLAPESGLHEAACELNDELRAAFGNAKVVIGVGGLALSVEGLRRSLIQAQHANRFGRLRPRDPGVVTYREVGSSRLLFALQDSEVRASFGEAVLSPLFEHDRRRNSDLVHTLDVFLDHCGHWKQAADELHVHVNTLRHRIERIEAITGRDLESMDDRVDFFVALNCAIERSPLGAMQLSKR
jgi:sugar diacid utilization regulator